MRTHDPMSQRRLFLQGLLLVHGEISSLHDVEKSGRGSETVSERLYAHVQVRILLTAIDVRQRLRHLFGRSCPVARVAVITSPSIPLRLLRRTSSGKAHSTGSVVTRHALVAAGSVSAASCNSSGEYIWRSICERASKIQPDSLHDGSMLTYAVAMVSLQ